MESMGRRTDHQIVLHLPMADGRWADFPNALASIREQERAADPGPPRAWGELLACGRSQPAARRVPRKGIRVCPSSWNCLQVPTRWSQPSGLRRSGAKRHGLRRHALHYDGNSDPANSWGA